MSSSFWSEVKVEVSSSFGEVVADAFQEEGAGGVIYEDPFILSDHPCRDDEYVGTEALATVPGKFGIRAYFPVDDRLGERLNRLKEKLSGILGYSPDFKLTQVQEEDWAEAWKRYFKPEHIGKIVIKPSWEEYYPQTGEEVVELDPGMAFGTGTHPTTRLCILLLQEIAPGRTAMLDIGTGSGILALVGARLGIKQIVATDIDPLAVKVAEANIHRNQLEQLIQVRESDFLHRIGDQKFDLVVANIITNAIIQMIPELDKVLEPSGFFLASGIIDERFGEVKTALESHGFQLLKVLSDEGWVGLLAGKANSGGSE